METHLEKKFYVPNISEFHVGFEYELQDPITKIWVNFIFEEDKLWFVKSNKYRVKYLDKEDIESCEFISTNSKEFAQDVDEYGYNISIGGGRITLSKYKNKITITNFPHMRSSRILFEGIIKNISELKKVLLMLGIRE